jgi:hypothetical protein
LMMGRGGRRPTSCGYSGEEFGMLTETVSDGGVVVADREKGKAIVFNKSNPKIVAELRKLMASDPLRYTQGFVADQAGILSGRDKGYSGSYVSTYMNGKWTDENCRAAGIPAENAGKLTGKWSGKDFEPAIEKWLATERLERERRKKADFFIKNEVTRKVISYAERAITHGRPTAITGPAGIGKTRAMERLCLTRTDILSLQCGPTDAAGWDIEKALLFVLTSTTDQLDMTLRRSDCIVNFFVRYRRPLWVDDFHLLHKSAFDFLLLKLGNTAKIPLIMTGNEDGYTKKLQSYPEQLPSRVHHVKVSPDGAFSKPIVADFLRHSLGPEMEVSALMIDKAHAVAAHPGLGHLRTLAIACEVALDEMVDGAPDVEAAFLLACDEQISGARKEKRGRVGVGG